jgi:hypothetical protein
LRSSDLEIDRKVSDGLATVGKRFTFVIAQKCKRQTDALPFPCFRKDPPEHPRLTGPNLNDRLVGFKFDDEVTVVESMAQVAVPFEDTDLLNIGDCWDRDLVDQFNAIHFVDWISAALALFKLYTSSNSAF